MAADGVRRLQVSWSFILWLKWITRSCFDFIGVTVVISYFLCQS